MKITFQKVHDRAVKDDHVTTVEIGMEENAATVQKMSEKRGEGLQLVALESLHRARLPALRLLLPVLMMILKGRNSQRVENYFYQKPVEKKVEGTPRAVGPRSTVGFVCSTVFRIQIKVRSIFNSKNPPKLFYDLLILEPSQVEIAG